MAFFTIVLLILIIVFFKSHRKTFGSILFLLSLILIYNLIPYWTTKSVDNRNTEKANTTAISVIFVNVNSQNDQSDETINYLGKSSKDFVLLVETNKYWGEKLNQLKSAYPYSKGIIKEGNFGMAVLSKHPLEVTNTLIDKRNLIPTVFLKTKINSNSLHLVLLHAHPPIGKYGTLARDRYLNTLSKKIKDLPSPLIVCGDFNTSPWTAIFQSFLKISGLDLPRKSLKTWPTTPLLPTISIDHCLSKGLSLTSYRRGPKIGSDHWPIELNAVY